MTQEIEPRPVVAARTSLQNPLLMRISITFATLLTFQLCSLIPLPGVDLIEAARTFSDGTELSTLVMSRMSVFGLGLTPIYSALILTEVLMMIMPDRRQLLNGARTSESFQRRVLIFALAIAALQAWGIATGLQMIDKLIPQPGIEFRAATVVSMVAATALLAWLASVIGRLGVGSGFWLLLVTPDLVSAFITGQALFQSVMMGVMPLPIAVLPLVFLAAATVALVALEKANPGLTQSGSTIWPPVLASAVCMWLLVPALPFLTSDQMTGAATSVLPGHELRIAALAILTPVLTFWRLRSLEDAGIQRIVNTPVTVALLLTAIVIAGELVIAKTAMLGLPDGQTLIIVVSVAISILLATKRSL